MNSLLMTVSMLFSSTQAYANPKPPLTGKYFYADIKKAETYGLHYVEMNLGSNNVKMSMSISSDQFMTGVFETTCVMDGATCQVPTLWDYSASTTAVTTGNIYNYRAQIFGNNQDLEVNKLTGIGYNDTMNFDLDAYGRQTTVSQATFMAVIESTTSYKSQFDGHLGLAPYSERPEFKQYNFMW